MGNAWAALELPEGSLPIPPSNLWVTEGEGTL